MRPLSILVIIAVIGWASMAHAIECQSKPDSKGRWSWRSVDGKKCWYKGSAVISKSKLRWPEKKKIMDPVFPIHGDVKTPKWNEFNELDAQADIEMFFNAQPLLNWPPVLMPLMTFQ